MLFRALRSWGLSNSTPGTVSRRPSRKPSPRVLQKGVQRSQKVTLSTAGYMWVLWLNRGLNSIPNSVSVPQPQGDPQNWPSGQLGPISRRKQKLSSKIPFPVVTADSIFCTLCYTQLQTGISSLAQVSWDATNSRRAKSLQHMYYEQQAEEERSEVFCVRFATMLGRVLLWRNTDMNWQGRTNRLIWETEYSCRRVGL